MLHIVLVGPAGSGKSHLSEEIICKLFNNAKIIATGAISRKLAEEDSEQGHSIAKIIEEGDLVDNKILYPYVVDELMRLREQTDVVIWDGYPRMKVQLRDFYHFTAEDVVIKIDLDVPYKVIAERITGRKQCPSCNREVVGNGPTCECGAKLVQRADDNMAVWMKRYNHFNEKIKPMTRQLWANLVITYKGKEYLQDTLDQIEMFINTVNS